MNQKTHHRTMEICPDIEGNESLTLKDREWLCPECNTNHDRDINASINILTFGRAGIAQT